MIYKRFLFLFAILLCVVLSVDGATQRFTVCIDAGHGGGDHGAPGKVTKEKTLTLRYALAFGRIIEQNCPDVKVVYTRKTDRFIELWQRAEIANKAKADLFISGHIHTTVLEKRGNTVFLNPGSAALSKREDKRNTFAVLDKKTISIYDIDTDEVLATYTFD